MEHLVEVRCVEVSMSCDKCKVGTMKPTGYSYMTSPPKYPHVCTNCDYSETYRKTYPCIEYRNVEESK